ncbi:MAG: hypothetical protein WAM07_10610 [Halobacillus sp.]|uniref:hypothetical protein n=1 Tax=Halobacillus sp. TaxID=56800 RepID=UPI003BAFFF22
MRKRLYSIILAVFAGVAAYAVKPGKVQAPTNENMISLTYPGTNIIITPGDLLFTPIGKSESKYAGHVGIVNSRREVIHSIPSGLMKDPISRYFNKFRSITIFSARDPETGMKACIYLDHLHTTYPKADYKVFTPLGYNDHEQYCTKIVWQSYYYGAGINLGRLSEHSLAIHPILLKDKRHLNCVAKNL